MKNEKSFWCPYCLKAAELVTGETVYPHRQDLYEKKFYYCGDCNAWVGCHQGSDKPLGRIANAELRSKKIQAHAAFDPLWREGDSKLFKTRKKAYSWLADVLGIEVRRCHIGWFDEKRCDEVVEKCKNLILESNLNSIVLQKIDE